MVCRIFFVSWFDNPVSDLAHEPGRHRFAAVVISHGDHGRAVRRASHRNSARRTRSSNSSGSVEANSTSCAVPNSITVRSSSCRRPLPRANTRTGIAPVKRREKLSQFFDARLYSLQSTQQRLHVTRDPQFLCARSPELHNRNGATTGASTRVRMCPNKDCTTAAKEVRDCSISKLFVSAVYGKDCVAESRACLRLIHLVSQRDSHTILRIRERPLPPDGRKSESFS